MLCFLRSILVAVILFIGLSNDSSAGEPMGFTVGPGIAPVRNIFLVAPVEKQEKFFQQLTAFANLRQFSIHVDENRPLSNKFIVTLERENILVLALNPFEPENIKVRFYREGGEEIDDGVFESLADELINLLRDEEFDPVYKSGINSSR